MPINQTTAPLHPVVADNGLVFATMGTWFNGAALQALHLSDGTPAWDYNFGPISSIGHPTVVGGVVYLGNGQAISPNTPAQMWAIHATSGIAVWQTPFGAQWEQYFAPLVTTDYVYSDTGYGGGLSAFAVSDGTTAFFNGAIGQYDSWSAAAFGGDIFTFIAGNLRAHDSTTGNILWTVTVPWNWSGSMNTAPVFGPTYGYVISPPSLYAIDPVNHVVAWSKGGGYSGTPAIANGVVYGTSAGNLIARNADDGSLLWTFTGDAALQYPPVIANGTVYVASDKNVYAVDATTYVQVWTAAVGGWVSVASRRLLVASTDGTLHAFLMSK